MTIADSTTPTATATDAVRRYVLVPAGLRAMGRAAQLRRYRLARIRLEGERATSQSDRFAYLRRAHD